MNEPIATSLVIYTYRQPTLRTNKQTSTTTYVTDFRDKTATVAIIKWCQNLFITIIPIFLIKDTNLGSKGGLILASKG